jgi:hypothetical protein
MSFKKYLSISLILLINCIGKNKTNVTFTEAEILEQLNFAFKRIPSQYFPVISSDDVNYNFFLDLEHGYCVTASSRIHLYADGDRWAIVFEKCGYSNRGTNADIELNYIGNCIDYSIQNYDGRTYVDNTNRIVIIDMAEFNRIENKDGVELETFELIGRDVKEVKIREKFVPFDNDYKHYEQVGIKIRDYENPKKLIGFEDFLRFLNETNPEAISASEDEIKKMIPDDLPKLMTINEFHFESIYASDRLPSSQETYQLIAKVLTTKDTTSWKPTLKPNNHWSNWESGGL